MPELKTVYDNDFVKEVVDSDLPVAVYCYSHACPASLRTLVVAESAAEKYAGKVKFVKVNVSGSNWVANRYVVCRVPTLMIFDSGREVERIVWTDITEESITRLLDQALVNQTPAEPAPV